MVKTVAILMPGDMGSGVGQAAATSDVTKNKAAGTSPRASMASDVMLSVKA